MADAITPGRKTSVVFNDYLPKVVQEYFETLRDTKAWGDGCVFDETYLTERIGIRLQGSFEKAHVLWETETGGEIDETRASVPSDFLFAYYYKQNPGTGITYAAGSAQAQKMLQKQRASGTTWASSLSADATAFPGPADDHQTAHLDRVLVSNDIHEPTDQVIFTFSIPASAFQSLGTVAAFYFSGPAGGSGETDPGVGQYSLLCDGRGLARLFERTQGAAWVHRYTFTYASDMRGGALHAIAVATDAAKLSSGAYTGSLIAFKTTHPGSLGDGFVAQAVSTIRNGYKVNRYHIAKPGAITTPEKIRVDARRDVRLILGAANERYSTSGTFQDALISTDMPLTTAKDLYLAWYGDRPTGTTVEVELTWPDFATPVTSSGSMIVDDSRGQIVQFAVPAPAADSEGNTIYPTRFYATFTLTGPGTATPTVYNYAAWRDAVVDTNTVTQYTANDTRGTAPSAPTFACLSVQIAGTKEDPASESANLVVADLTGTNPTLKWRTGTPITVELRDESTGTLLSRLFRGIIGQSQPKLLGKDDGRAYPGSTGHITTFNASGEWARLQRRMAVGRITLYDDSYTDGETGAKAPMKVTSAIRYLLEQAGYTTSQIDIPDRDIRIFGQAGDNDKADLLTIEESTTFADTIRQLCEDYLGARMAWDANSGTGGMWRLIERKVPPYNYLMRFHIAHPGAKKAPHRLESYSSITLGTGQIQVGNYIVGGSESYSYEPPEGNIVRVFGGGDSGAVQKASAFAFNPESFNIFGLSPGHDFYPDPDGPDYLGEAVPIHVYDVSLTTQAAAQWVCRRIFDTACFGREYMRFKAPLRFVVDIDDASQVTPRPLRFGDPVEIEQRDGSFRTYLCTKCDPIYDNDDFQFADYEFVTTTNIDTVGLLPSSYDLHSLTRSRIQAAKRAMGQTARDNTGRAKGRQYAAYASIVSTWPALAGSALQYMDPAETNFGQFLHMEGYDPY